MLQPQSFFPEWRLRPDSPGNVFFAHRESRLPLTHEGGLRRLTRLCNRRLWPTDISLLALSYGAGNFEFFAFEPESERPRVVGYSMNEDWLLACGLLAGVNARGERAWTYQHQGQEVELVQLGWVNVMAGVRREFVAQIPLWRVSTGEQWRILKSPQEWPEIMGLLLP